MSQSRVPDPVCCSGLLQYCRLRRSLKPNVLPVRPVSILVEQFLEQSIVAQDDDLRTRRLPRAGKSCPDALHNVKLVPRIETRRNVVEDDELCIATVTGPPSSSQPSLFISGYFFQPLTLGM